MLGFRRPHLLIYMYIYTILLAGHWHFSRNSHCAINLAWLKTKMNVSCFNCLTQLKDLHCVDVDVYTCTLGQDSPKRTVSVLVYMQFSVTAFTSSRNTTSMVSNKQCTGTNKEHINIVKICNIS